MKRIKNILYNLFLYFFTISDDVKKSSVVVHRMYIHVLYRVLIILVLLLLGSLIFKGFFDVDTLSQNIVKSILMFIVLRFFTKKYVDEIIHLMFYKDTYQTPEIPIKEIRKNKLRKINKSKHWLKTLHEKYKII